MERRFWQPGRPTLWAGLTGLLVLISLLMVVAKRWNAASCAPQEGETKQVGYSNRLIHESSPYLLMHAHNPVDWYPWGEEALTKAKKEDKPIFLSIGYSTCHWCHVMEEKVFSDPKIAELMNEHFVSIKVDREERPDIDEIYMTTVQLMTGGGGWPLSAFLTPQGKAFFGGTYFPRTSSSPYVARPLRPGAAADKRLKTLQTRLWRRSNNIPAQARSPTRLTPQLSTRL